MAAKNQKKISKVDGQKFNKASKKPFKTKKQPKPDAAPSKASAVASALQLEDDIPDFPRGGRSSMSSGEREGIRSQVDAEYVEEEHRFTKIKRKQKMRKQGDEAADDFGSLFGHGITGKPPRFANKITFKNISTGMKLWGVVAEVNEKDLVISLPCGLRGLVRATDAFDPILGSEIEDNEGISVLSAFSVGQLVSCIVLQLDDERKEKGNRKIWLSLRLSLLHKGFTLDALQEGMVLTAYLKSIEDHGYILHFGLPSFTGFLPKSSQAESSGVEVRAGQLLQGVVRRIDRTRKLVYLNSDPDTVSKYLTKDMKGISMDLIIPGMMVNARVQSILENGIMLSFLTYFTGTVDIFHLQNAFSTPNWKDEYNVNKKVNARILFTDPATRAIGLTLNPHLVHNKAPPSHIKIGDIYDQSKVVRVDRGVGLLLEIPSIPQPSPAYVSISDVAEEEVRKLEKKFKEGSRVRVRIIGFRHLEGLATGILKASAFEGPVFTHSDVKPGMVVRAKIIAVDSFGAIVQFPGGVKALCPLRHMSELEISKPTKKFKIGADLVFRVLGCKSKRITVTHKKTLVKSKLGILSSYADATDGLITHGWITKIEKHGCFVRFYNGVQGFAPRFELGLEPGGDPSSIYHVGEVVKCRITSSVLASRRLNLSFIMKPTRVAEDDEVKLGTLVSGVVEDVTPRLVVVYVKAKGYLKGTISTEHLADHHEHAVLMKSALKPGYEFEKLLVLDIVGNSLLLSAKYSLINLAGELPSDFSQIHPNTVVHGYICNLIETGCFVRFAGRLTGFCPRSKAMDDQRTDLSKAFYIGQSVRSNILDVSCVTGRITLSLKQSCCSSMDASFIQEYFLVDEKIAILRTSDSKGSKLKWVEGFNVGCVIEGKIQEAKDIGVVVSFENYNDILGFITHYQLGGATVETGSIVRAAVLDVAKAEHLVDLSLKQELINKFREESSSKKKRKREASKDLELHQTVNAVVEIVKENYLVLSLPEHNYAIGYASVSDYNTQEIPQKKYLNGQSVAATVMALPSPSTAGRMLLLLKSISKVTETSSSKRAKKKSTYNVGSVIQAEITEIKALELGLNFGIGFRGRVHITEVSDDGCLENPFGNFRIGQTVTAVIVAKPNEPGSKKGHQWELSIKPSKLTGPSDMGGNLMSEEFDFSTGHLVSGYVYKVDTEWAWLTISRHLNGQLYILDSACEPNELEQFQKRFSVGTAVSAHVLFYNKEKKLLRLVLRPVGPISDRNIDGGINNLQSNFSNENVMAYTHEGDIVGGRIFKIFPGVGGLLVQIGPHMYGRVHFTELKDSWVADPLSGYYEGQFVKCKVLEISQSVKGTLQVDLSLRLSSDGMVCQNSTELCNHVDTPSKHVEKIEDLSPNMVVQGYVKNVMSKGCFISLSRKIDAKILLSNLSDGYVDNPEREFPIGKLVVGRVLSVEPLSQRVEVTLKTSNASRGSKSVIDDLSSLNVGDTVYGMVKRVESFGLFIAIDHTNMVGLCHVSELSEERIDNIESKYRAGEKVMAKILKVDEERHRISLGMKNSYFRDNTDIVSEKESDEDVSKNDSTDETMSIILPDSSSLGVQHMDIHCENGEGLVLADAEARASIPPLEVPLDDMENLDLDKVVIQNHTHMDEETDQHEKNNRWAKKKAKTEREQEIRAAEERLLEKDAPRTADEYEKLVRSSPNNSFVWIKYMTFMLSLADVEKARAIAERALRTINIREEKEKLNIWVAYFNLENEYGNPPEDAVEKVFQRALQYCDSKKVHLALLGMYERTEQHKLADELLNKMIKKFKQSCKVWLRRVQSLLKQKQDGVQSIVKRALLSLPRHKHIKFISQTAILEFKCGSPDRARSMLEGILREYPKRTDLWSLYLDQEIRLGDTDMIRALFERAISLSLPPKKMKFLFTKYLEYEKARGDEEQIESVKRKAMDYVESTMA